MKLVFLGNFLFIYLTRAVCTVAAIKSFYASTSREARYENNSCEVFSYPRARGSSFVFDLSVAVVIGSTQRPVAHEGKYLLQACCINHLETLLILQLGKTFRNFINVATR